MGPLKTHEASSMSEDPHNLHDTGANLRSESRQSHSRFGFRYREQTYLASGEGMSETVHNLFSRQAFQLSVAEHL